MARCRSPGSWMVSASVNSSHRPRALRAAVQMAFALPCPARFQLRGLHHVTPAKLRAISAVRSVEWSSTTISSQSRPSWKTSSDCATSDSRHAPRHLLLVPRGNNHGEFHQLLRLRLVKNRCQRAAGNGNGSPGSSESPSTGFQVRPTDPSASGLSVIRPRPFFRYPSLRIIRMCACLLSSPLVLLVALSLPAAAIAARIPPMPTSGRPTSPSPTARTPSTWRATAAKWCC